MEWGLPTLQPGVNHKVVANQKKKSSDWRAVHNKDNNMNNGYNYNYELILLIFCQNLMRIELTKPKIY
jgi:hypothetical protein